MSSSDLKEIDYEADGLHLTGYFAPAPGDAPAPGILVAHEAPGVGDHVKERAQRLAEKGYAAFALDMYGAEGAAETDAMAKHTALLAAPGAMRRRARAALDVLQAQKGVDTDRLACIGFCQGGITAMELARDGAPIKAAVGFHPALIRPAGSEPAPISAHVLMMVGTADPVSPAEARAAFEEEMTASGADWQMLLFGGVGHSYTNRLADSLGMPGFAYSESADKRSWAVMLNLLEEIF
jgi:dienelactone hydrolase